MVQINNLMSGIWKAFGILLAAALVVNAIQAAMGTADLAYWQYPALAVSWVFGRLMKEDEEDEDVCRGRK